MWSVQSSSIPGLSGASQEAAVTPTSVCAARRPKLISLPVLLTTLKSNHMLSFGAPVVLCIWNNKVWMPPAPCTLGVLVAAGGCVAAGGAFVGGTAVACGGGGAAASITGRSLILPSKVATRTDTQPVPFGPPAKLIANHWAELSRPTA